MAAKSTKLSTSLVIKVKTGVDSKTGKDINKNVSLGKIMFTATDQDIYDVVVGIGKVLPYAVYEIEKVDYNDVTNA